MLWILAALICCGITLVAGALIARGASDDPEDEDYMMLDDNGDWGDKS